MSIRGTAELPRLYGDLAEWYDLVIPLASVRDECLLFRDLLVEACTGPARSILDLGSGAGHTVHHLKGQLAATLVDLSPEMVEAGRKLNPECEHHVADMRTAA